MKSRERSRERTGAAPARLRRRCSLALLSLAHRSNDLRSLGFFRDDLLHRLGFAFAPGAPRARRGRRGRGRRRLRLLARRRLARLRLGLRRSAPRPSLLCRRLDARHGRRLYRGPAPHVARRGGLALLLRGLFRGKVLLLPLLLLALLLLPLLLLALLLLPLLLLRRDLLLHLLRPRHRVSVGVGARTGVRTAEVRRPARVRRARASLRKKRVLKARKNHVHRSEAHFGR